MLETILRHLRLLLPSHRYQRSPSSGEKENIPMSHSTKFKMVGDGKTPGTTPWGVNLRAALGQTIQPESKARIDLGLVCDDALLVWASSMLTDLGLELEGGMQVVYPGAPLQFVVKNKTKAPVQIEEGQSVLCASAQVGHPIEVQR
jgi:hypothetical protein